MKDHRVVVTADVARVSSDYAKKMKISEDEALRLFFGSVTYRVLMNTETGLCYEMYDAIYEMFLEEMSVQ